VNNKYAAFMNMLALYIHFIYSTVTETYNK